MRSETLPRSIALDDDAEWRRLDNQSVHIWCVPLDRSDHELRDLEMLLSVEECERAANYRFLKDRDRFLVRRGVLRLLSARYLEIAPREVSFEQNEFCRPRLSAVHSSQIDFNLTHSSGLALIAFTKSGSIGVDLEEIRPLCDLERLVENVLSDSEKTVFSSIKARSKLETFYRYWTSKEAYLKLLGTGLNRAPQEYEVRFKQLADLGEAVLSRQGVSIPAVRIQNFSPQENYLASIAIPTHITKIQTHIY